MRTLNSYASMSHSDVLRLAHSKARAENSAMAYCKRLGFYMKRLYALVRNARREAQRVLKASKVTHGLAGLAVLALAVLTVLSFTDAGLAATLCLGVALLLAMVSERLKEAKRVAKSWQGTRNLQAVIRKA